MARTMHTSGRESRLTTASSPTTVKLTGLPSTVRVAFSGTLRRTTWLSLASATWFWLGSAGSTPSVQGSLLGSPLGSLVTVPVPA